MSPEYSPEQRAQPEQPLGNEMPEMVIATPEMKRKATAALEHYLAGMRRAQDAPRFSMNMLKTFQQSRSDVLSLARKKEDPARDIQAFNHSADALLAHLLQHNQKTERPTGFAKLPQQTDLSKSMETMDSQEKMALLRTLMENRELSPDIRRRIQQLDIARTILEDQLTQAEEPKTRWGRFMNIRRKIGIPSLTRTMGLPEREEDARETLRDAHRFTLESELPKIRQDLFGGVNSFMGEIDRHPYMKSVLQEAGLSIVDAQSDEEILGQYAKLASYLNTHKSYERAARLVEELLPEEFAKAEKNISATRYYELVRDAHDHAKRIRTRNEEIWKHPSQEMREHGAEPMTDEQITQMEQRFYEEKRAVLIHEEAAKHIDGSALSGAKGELWKQYADIVNPNGLAKKETWDKIADEVAINAPLIMVSGGVASAARAGLSRGGCWLAGKVIARQAAKVGIETGATSALELGTGAVARWAGTNVLKRGTLAAAGLLTEGAAFEISNLGLQGEWIGNMPDWGQRILWSAATLGAFHGSGKLSERLFSKTLMEGGKAVTRDVLLGNYLSRISNGAVREAAKQILAKGHIEAATMMLVSAVQNGAYQGNLDEFFENFGNDLLHSYISVGALKVGHAGVRAVMGKPGHSANDDQSVENGKETKHPVSPEVTQIKDYLKSHPIDDATRVQVAETLLGRTFPKSVTDALLAAHGKPGAIDEGNMTKNIFKEGPIYDALRAEYEKNMPAEQAHERAMKETKLILDAGLAGAPPPPPRKEPLPAHVEQTDMKTTEGHTVYRVRDRGKEFLFPEGHIVIVEQGTSRKGATIPANRPYEIRLHRGEQGQLEPTLHPLDPADQRAGDYSIDLSQTTWRTPSAAVLKDWKAVGWKSKTPDVPPPRKSKKVSAPEQKTVPQQATPAMERLPVTATIDPDLQKLIPEMQHQKNRIVQYKSKDGVIVTLAWETDTGLSRKQYMTAKKQLNNFIGTRDMFTIESLYSRIRKPNSPDHHLLQSFETYIAQTLTESIATGRKLGLDPALKGVTIEARGNLEAGNGRFIRIPEEVLELYVREMKRGNLRKLEEFRKYLSSRIVHEMTHSRREHAMIDSGADEIGPHAIQFLSSEGQSQYANAYLLEGALATRKGSKEKYDVAQTNALKIIFQELIDLAKQKICAPPHSYLPDDLATSIATLPANERSSILSELSKKIINQNTQSLLVAAARTPTLPRSLGLLEGQTVLVHEGYRDRNGKPVPPGSYKLEKRDRKWIARSLNGKVTVEPLLEGMTVRLASDGQSMKGATIPAGEYVFNYAFNKSTCEYTPALRPKNLNEEGYSIDFSRTKIE